MGPACADVGTRGSGVASGKCMLESRLPKRGTELAGSPWDVSSCMCFQGKAVSLQPWVAREQFLEDMGAGSFSSLG